MSEQASGLNSTHETGSFLNKISAQEILDQAFSYSLEQIQSGAIFLTEEYDADWPAKIRALFLGISDRTKIEALGKIISLAQSLEILNASVEKDQEWKLGPLILGMPYRVFCQILMTAEGHQLELLKRETASESIQRHLVFFIHEINRFQQTLNQSAATLIREISDIDYKAYANKEVELIQTKLQNIYEHVIEQVEKLNRALELAWKTGRPDIVDNLSSLKENSLKFLEIVIGVPRSEKDYPTGIYKVLEDHLSQVFANITDLEQLQDEDSVIDALAFLGLKYIEDYKRQGWFCDESNEIAINKIGDMLEQKGLRTVGDLKLHRIFSLESFKDYIEQNGINPA